jgi:uncharacterized RDD family membrane protein YckC
VEDAEAIIASRGERLMAKLIDTAIILPIYLGFKFVQGNSGVTSVIFFLFLCVAIVQFILLTNSGQTIGKKIMKIRIVRVSTNSNGGFVINVLMRSFLNGIICVIPFYLLIDDLFIFRQDHRCIHDFIAGTHVIKSGATPKWDSSHV